MGAMAGWRDSFFILTLGLGVAVGWCDAPAANGPSNFPASRPALSFPAVNDAALPNARWVAGNVLCGGLPESDAGFAKLQALGIKTVISVDGLKPDVELARRYGLRYVHLPFGYDGVPVAQGQAIAKAIAELPGPVYVHCHHGMHRAPAAAAVACIIDGALAPDAARSVLEAFGTGRNYTGLWRSAAEAQPMAPATLHDLKVEFRETAKLPPLADAMVEVDARFDRLKAVQAAGWRPPSSHPDLDPPHEALQLSEMFHEIGRSDAARGKSDDFLKKLADAEQATNGLRAALVAHPADSAGADAAFKRVGASCTACHKAHRDSL